MQYSEMTKKEQRLWRKQFVAFTIEQLPLLMSSRNNWKSELNEVAKTALGLINVFLYAQPFVKDSLFYEDYRQRITAMKSYFDRINKELEAQFKADETEAEPKKVGRPPKPVKASKEPPVEQVELFDDSTFTDTNCALPSSDQFMSLRQLKWLLSADTALQVDNIRNIRAVAASEAELAKDMAMKHAPKNEVAKHAQNAAVNTEKYEDVYVTVDEELATVYLRLKEDVEFLKQFVLKYKVNKQQIENLKKSLKPYFSKQNDKFIEKVHKLIDDNNPKIVAEREAEAQIKKKQAAIIKYLKRTDKPNTDKRIAGMKKKLKELEKLSGREVSDTYAPLLQVAIEDFKKKNSDISEEKKPKPKTDKKKKK